MNKPPPPESGDRWLYWLWKYVTDGVVVGTSGVRALVGSAPIAVSGSGTVTVSHNTSGVAAGTYGGTAGVPRFDIDARGHVLSGSNVAFPVDVVPIVGSAPILVTGTSTGTYTVAHDTSGVAAGTYGDGTSVPQVQVDARGHIVLATSIPLAISTGNFRISTFTAAGTWTKPENALMVGALMYSGGGGGGAGRGYGTATVGTCAGGGGGGGSAMEFRFWSAAELAAATHAVVIGAGGTGALGTQTTTFNGTTGGPGGTTTFFGVTVDPGKGGLGGSVGTGGSGGAGGTAIPSFYVSTNTGTTTTSPIFPIGLLRWSAPGAVGGRGAQGTGTTPGMLDGSTGGTSTGGGAAGGGGGAGFLQLAGPITIRGVGGTGGDAGVLLGGWSTAGTTTTTSLDGESSNAASGIRGGAGGGGGYSRAPGSPTQKTGGAGGQFGGGGGGGAAITNGTGAALTREAGGHGGGGVVVVITLVGP